VNGKPRPVPIAYLGRSADILARLQATEPLRVRSLSHGAVAALSALGNELDVAGTIDRHLAEHGRRLRPAQKERKESKKPKKHDGLSVGQSLALIAIGRACHATSKRGFAEWASTTTLGELSSAPVERLSSQHFWDQMDQLPVESIAEIEKELVGRALQRFDLKTDTLLYDATNFFTYIASTNKRPELPVRGHNKQQRHDLRQIGVALLCTRSEGIPLSHRVYAGNVPDAKSFADVLPLMRQRLVDLQRDLDSLTLVYDKGNVSRANQKQVDQSGFHYVASLTASSQRALIAEANSKFEPVSLGKETIQAFKVTKTIWGAERVVVVVVSERLRDGQRRGILQHVGSAQRWLERLASTLRRGKQKRDRAKIERDIETRLMGRQHLRKVLRVALEGTGRKLAVTYSFDQAAFDELSRDWLGRLVLVTDQKDWSTSEIIRAYRGQSDVEAVFAHLKDPLHVALRPQFHWTDQKLHVHVFTCLLGYLLARLVYLRAQRATAYDGSMERLLETLEKVRRVTVIRQTSETAKPRVTIQLEEIDAEILPILEALKIAA
jgi:transposase